MKKLVMVMAMTCASLPAIAASEADCQAMWKKADTNNDGVLSEQEALQYSAMMQDPTTRLCLLTESLLRLRFWRPARATCTHPERTTPARRSRARTVLRKARPRTAPWRQVLPVSQA